MDDESLHEHQKVPKPSDPDQIPARSDLKETRLCFFRRGIALAALGGPIYAIGGLDDNSCFNDVERYDIESDSWSAVAPMNTPRGGVGSVALGVRLRGERSGCASGAVLPPHRTLSARTLCTPWEATTAWRLCPAWSALTPI